MNDGQKRDDSMALISELIQKIFDGAMNEIGSVIIVSILGALGITKLRKHKSVQEQRTGKNSIQIQDIIFDDDALQRQESGDNFMQVQRRR